MTAKRFLAWGLPLGPNIRMRLFWEMFGTGPQFSETDRRIDIIPQNGLPRIHVPGKQALDGFAEQLRLAILGIAADAAANGLLEVAGQNHVKFLV